MEGVVVKNIWPSNYGEDNGDITSGENNVKNQAFIVELIST